MIYALKMSGEQRFTHHAIPREKNICGAHYTKQSRTIVASVWDGASVCVLLQK
jgi:hypothetical protein